MAGRRSVCGSPCGAARARPAGLSLTCTLCRCLPPPLCAQRGCLDLVLKRRRGFVKLALEADAELVPAIAFGAEPAAPAPAAVWPLPAAHGVVCSPCCPPRRHVLPSAGSRVQGSSCVHPLPQGRTTSFTAWSCAPARCWTACRSCLRRWAGRPASLAPTEAGVYTCPPPQPLAPCCGLALPSAGMLPGCCPHPPCTCSHTPLAARHRHGPRPARAADRLCDAAPRRPDGRRHPQPPSRPVPAAGAARDSGGAAAAPAAFQR